MTEADHQAHLEQRARQRGWRVWRTPRSDQAEAGEADLRCLWRSDAGPCPGPHRYLVAELKTRGRHRTDPQRQAATDYAAAGVACYEWRLPEDLPQAEALLGLEACAQGAVGRSEALRGQTGTNGPQAGVAAQGGAESVVPSDREVWLRQRSRQLQAEGIGACAAERTAEREWREALEMDAAAARRGEGHELG